MMSYVSLYVAIDGGKSASELLNEHSKIKKEKGSTDVTTNITSKRPCLRDLGDMHIDLFTPDAGMGTESVDSNLKNESVDNVANDIKKERNKENTSVVVPSNRIPPSTIVRKRSGVMSKVPIKITWQSCDPVSIGTGCC